jgi:hypothetical protein
MPCGHAASAGGYTQLRGCARCSAGSLQAASAISTTTRRTAAAYYRLVVTPRAPEDSGISCVAGQPFERPTSAVLHAVNAALD